MHKGTKKKETDADRHDDPEPIQKREGPCDKGLYAFGHQRVGQPKRANLNLITNVDLFTNTHFDSSHILPFPHITASPASPQTQVSPTIHSASSTHRNVRSKPYLVVPLRFFQRRARCGRVKRVDEPRHPHPGRSRQLLAVRKYFRHAELPAIRSPCQLWFLSTTGPRSVASRYSPAISSSDVHHREQARVPNHRIRQV